MSGAWPVEMMWMTVAVMPVGDRDEAKYGSCTVCFTCILFIIPEGDDYTPFIKKEIKKTTLFSSPTGPFLSTSVEPYQVPGSPAGSQGGGIHGNGATRLLGRAIFLQKPSWHMSRAQCALSTAQILVQPQAPMGTPPTLGGRGRNFKLLKHSSKAPMWLVKPPKIIAVKQLLL